MLISKDDAYYLRPIIVFLFVFLVLLKNVTYVIWFDCSGQATYWDFSMRLPNQYVCSVLTDDSTNQLLYEVAPVNWCIHTQVPWIGMAALCFITKLIIENYSIVNCLFFYIAVRVTTTCRCFTSLS